MEFDRRNNWFTDLASLARDKDPRLLFTVSEFVLVLLIGDCANLRMYGWIWMLCYWIEYSLLTTS